jgi:transcription elongation factor Elf1
LHSNFINATKRATFECLRCGDRWDKPVYKILYDDYGCPNCKTRNKVPIDYTNDFKDVPTIISKKEEILIRVKDKLGLQLEGEYKTINDTYEFSCFKNNKHKHIRRNLYNIFLSLKENPDFIACPECRVDNRIKKLEEYCPNLELVEYKREIRKTSYYYYLKWRCKYCNHEFTRSDDEVLRGDWVGCNDCPECGHDRRKRFLNKVFDSIEVYRYQVDMDTLWVNNNYTKYEKSNEFHIDHVCSVLDCYKHCIPVWMCSSPINLRLISSGDNLTKSRHSDMTIEELIIKFSSWILDHSEYLKMIPKSDFKK